MAKPCIVKYKGKEYSVEQFSAMLHDGLLNNLIESGAIDQNKLKGDLKLLQDKGISFRYTLQEDGVSVILEGTEAINKGANAQTIRTGTRKNNNLKYIDNYSFDDVLNETYNTNSGAVSLAIKLGEGIFNYKKKNKTTGVVSKKSFVIPFLNIEAANKLKKLRKEYKKLNPPESKEEKARKAEDKRLLTKEQLKQKQAENRAKKAEERKLLSKEEKKAIADKNAKDKKRSAKIKEELNQITKQVLVDFHKMMVLNLLAIYDTLDQNFVKLSKDWYLGANRFANAYANKYKLTVEQAAAIIAVLSPQNDWFNNLSVAERVMEIMANYSNTKMTSDIIEKAIKNQTTGEEEKNFVDVLRAAYKKFGEVSIEDLRKMGATEEIQAIYLRAFDHAFHSNKVAMTDPTGKFIGFDTTPVRWNSTSEITKAITVYRDSSMVTINDQLGGGSKVRNFYNNIVDPNSPTPYVTSDTHAAAAAMAIPMSANDAGTGFKLFDSGLNPVYAMVKQAYISAADIVGLFPREFQSITWEGTRLGINDKNRTEEKKNETFNEVSKLRENQKTNAYENARAIIAINPSGNPSWGEDRGIKTQKSSFKDSESIRSDSNKRISEVSNYGGRPGELRGDSTRVGGKTTRGKADTGEVSFRFEKSGTATVKNAPKGTYLNIGLLKGETEELISIDDVLSNLPSDVKVIKQRQVTGTEPTLALQINRKMSDQEMEDFRNATAQMAIPQLSDGKGVIHGTQEWGEFNPEFFVLPNNKPLSSIKGVEITSVEPNEEVSVGAEVQSNWNYEGEGDAFASNKDARDGKSSYIIRMLNKGIGSGYYRAKQRGELDTESPLTYKGDKESVSAIDGNGNTVGIIQLQADGGIEHIVVAPEFSRKGIASELIKQIEQKGAKVIPEKSKIISPDAAKLFNKLQSLKAGEQEGPSFRKISGQDVANEAVEMGSDQGGISDFLANNIAKEDYTVETVSIEDLRNEDPYLDEYLNSGEVREFEGEPFAMRPIVSSIGEVLDGYNRIAQMVENGETEVEVYKGQPVEDINFRKEDIKRITDALQNVDEGIIQKIKNYLPYLAPSPKNKTTAYKLFRVKKNSPGQIFPLFVRADQSVPVGLWVKATPGETTEKAGKKRVKSTLGDLAYRPGWHSGDSPSSTHIGKKRVKSDTKPSIRPENQVWAEVEVGDDVDWQTEANKRAQKNKNGKVILNTAHITDQVPAGGYYKYKTNANMTGSWLISGEMKVIKILTDDEVADINKKLNSKDLKREAPLNFADYGFDSNGNPINKKLTEAKYIAEAYHKSKLDGTNPDLVKAVEDQIGEQEVSFRKDDKVKGTYFEPAMTTDSKGNYVFFHFSTAPLKSLMKGIDSRKYYSTRTSREEKGLQYGVASYYTKPTDSENVVGGDKYYVTISPDKVYPMDLDPNGYRAAAEKKFKKNTPFRESRISKEIANSAARDGYEMAVGEWSYDRAGLTESEIPEFRGDALVPLKPQEITGKEKFKTGKERGIKTEHPDKARLAFNQQVENLASDIDSYKSSKKKYDDGYSIANEVMTYGGIVEDYGTKNERVRPLTIEEFNTMTKGLPAKLKERADKLRSQMEDNEGLSFRIDELWHGTPHKVGKFSTSKIGTGEGAQMFGWGLYFTNLKSIAEGYAKALAKIRFKGESLDDNPIFEKLFVSLDASNDEFYNYGTGAITNLKKFKEYIDDMYQYLKRESNKVIDEYNPRVERFLGEWGGTNYDASIAKERLLLNDEQEKEFEKKVYEIYEANGLSKEEADRTLEMRGQSRKAALKSIYRAMKAKATRAERVQNAINFVKNDLKSDLNYYKFLSDNFDKFDLQRNLYKVSLHEGKDPSQYTYLEWYKPISEKIKTALLNFIAQDNKYSHSTWTGLKNKLKYRIENDMINTGEELYNTIAETSGLNPKQASLFLLDAGIDGVKYPAESISRGATDETARGFNYVVFDENAVTIEDEISFRFDNTRKLVTELRLQAILKGSNFKDLRNAINVSPTSFYTPQKYAQLKPQIASMSDAELLAAIDVETSLEDIFNNTDGPIIGLAFIEYINRLKNIVEDPNSTQGDIDNANELIQKAYESVAPFTTKVAQVLRQLGEIKSTIKKDEVQFYLDMIEALIEANGNMINDEHREALKGVIEVLLNSKKEHAAIFEDLANKGNNVTDQDIVDLNVAEVEMQNAHAALNMLVGFLSPPSSQDFWSGVMRGNLMSIRSALTGLYSNLLNIGVFRFRNLVQATLSIPFAILKKAGINTFGLEKYQLFNTPIISNIKYGLFLDVIQDALVGVAKAIATLSKMMIGKESFRGFLDKSPTANRVFNIIKYGSSGIEGGSPVILDKSNHTMTAIRKAMTPKGGKTRLNIRGIKVDVASSFKKIEFSKWFKANYPGSDYSSLSAKDKKIIQNEYFNDPKAMVPTFGGKVAGLGRAIMAVNSEFVFRLVALSDYLPKTYANNVEMTRLAQSLGLDEKQTILFMKDPARYIEIMSNVLSPEALNFWIDTVNEVTVTKDTGLGKASTAFVEALKNYVPKKLMDKFPALKDDKWFKSFVGLWQFGIDSVVPFVKIPMNAISLTADFLIPSKPLIKAIYFSGLALNNKGTDQAEAYALSAMKNYSMVIVALGIRSLAVGLVSIPGMVVLAPGKDDDDEKKKMKSKFSRMSININALRRYFSGEDPSYKEGDKYESLIAYGILGMVIYNYASISETSNKEYYDQLSKAPKNINPKDVVTGSPFDIAKSGALELELKAFQSSQFFIDQSWFVGLNSTLEGLTGGDTGRDKFVNNYIGTLLSLWWGFSSHAQQISDIYREATGKPVFDVTLPTELQGLNKQGYPGILGDRVWNNIFKKNELIHKSLMKTPEESEYVKFSMYGEPMSPVPGNTKNNLEIVLSVAAPARRVTPNLTQEERLYMAVYDNKNKINIPGYSVSLTEPMMNKTEKIKVFMPEGEEAESINVMIMPKEYNKINKMAGDALRDLHTVLLSEQGLLNYEVRGKVISPEDIMSKNWGNTREVANVRNAIAVAFSEGNKLLNTFLKPWELFGDDITKYIGRDKSATIQDAYSLIDSKISTYKVLNPQTGKMEMLENYLVGHPELSDKLYNLAKESILVYLKAAEEAVKNNEEWNKLMDNPEMTIEQEKARKEGNF